MKKIISLISLYFLFTGCATVVLLPVSTGQMPVVGGGLLKGKAGLDISNAIPVTIINDVSTNPPTRDEIKVGEDDNLIGTASGINSFSGSRIELSLGLLERLDFYYTNALGVRYMFLGDPNGTGWRSTVFAGFHSKGQGDSQGEGTSLISANTKISGYEFGVSAGKKVSDSSLFYMTLASRNGDANILVTQNQIEVGNYNDSLEQYLAALGVMLGSTWYFKFEVAGTHIIWKGSNTLGAPLKDSGTEIGATLGFGYAW